MASPWAKNQTGNQRGQNDNNTSVAAANVVCPRCGYPISGTEYHVFNPLSTWTASQMYNDPDKMYCCRF